MLEKEKKPIYFIDIRSYNLLTFLDVAQLRHSLLKFQLPIGGGMTLYTQYVMIK